MAVAFISQTSLAGGESYAIGRIMGTQRPLPLFFRAKKIQAAVEIDRVEFYGFRFVREGDGRTFLIRPNHEGFFHQALPPGAYTLTRKRSDRPSYSETRTLDILTFQVEPGALVNLGTLILALDGEPRESLILQHKSTRGTYIYSYFYRREPGAEAYSLPLAWFSEKKPKVADALGSRVVQVETAPTTSKDGSRVVLKEFEPMWEE